MKRVICFFTACIICLSALPAFAVEGQPELDVNARSVLLMEASTGDVLYEESPDEQLPIASVTKIMTMLLIMEAVDSGKIKMDDMVSVSERAMSMGGSTMFLETGEQLSVHDMLKGIAVASANDGCVAMAEFLAGSEAAFIDQMNQKAQELGMTHTHFANTNGLDADNHYSSARDVAIMSRELIKHKAIFEYTTIWMDTLRDGKFQLANTNKLIRFYSGANGLKTGSTSKALCCLSATALRDDMQLIAVVLGAPTSAERFSSAKALLDYGFATYGIHPQVTEGQEVTVGVVQKGVKETVSAVAEKTCAVLLKKGNGGEIQSEVKLDEPLSAPIALGQKIGEVSYKIGEQEIAKTNLVAEEAIEKQSFGNIFMELINSLIYGKQQAEELSK